MCFMLISKFFRYFADFYSFSDFLTIVLFYCFKWDLKTLLLIAALIFSAGCYSAPIFFYNSKNLNCIGALFFF